MGRDVGGGCAVGGGVDVGGGADIGCGINVTGNDKFSEIDEDAAL